MKAEFKAAVRSFRNVDHEGLCGCYEVMATIVATRGLRQHRTGELRLVLHQGDPLLKQLYDAGFDQQHMVVTVNVE